jgi:hypothetical protein
MTRVAVGRGVGVGGNGVEVEACSTAAGGMVGIACRVALLSAKGMHAAKSKGKHRVYKSLIPEL